MSAPTRNRTHPAQTRNPRPLTSPRIEQFLADHHDLSTPFLVLDLDVVREQYERLCAALPQAGVFYAVKANPDPSVIALLVAAGSNFDVASIGEVDLCLRLGATPDRLSYGNTIKKERDVAAAGARGVGTFTVDSRAELHKVIRQVPGSRVLVRLATSGCDADWPLSRKFGCSAAEADQLLHEAVRHGLTAGVSFHVGSQQRNPYAWDEPLAVVESLADSLRRAGSRLSCVNLGGGLPSTHLAPTPDVAEYGACIEASLRHRLSRFPDLTYLVEPGRFLVGDAGVIRSEVVLVSDRESDRFRRWVYLDIGMFNGLMETQEEAIRYRIRGPRDDAPLIPCVVAGPTCDSLDVLYEREEYLLPADLAVGDHVDLLSTGAYTTSYSSVWFNGFEPLNAYHLPATQKGRSSR